MKELIVATKEEFIRQYDDIFEDIALPTGSPVKRVYSGYNQDTLEETPYIGCEYENGTYSIVGLGKDRFCSFEEMIRAVLDLV